MVFDAPTLAVLAALLLGGGPGPSGTYSGRANETSVAIPHLAAEVRVDGSLAEAVWGGAALLTGFSEYTPVDGQPAQDSTEVLTWYDDHAIYFGIRAFEPHGAVHATLADRDRIDGDDWVRVLLDTFHDARRAMVFGVNPLGVQMDGVLSEGGRNGGLDLSPDFVFASKGHVTAWGYEVEVRIPFKSLRYPAVPTQDWGIQILRRPQHSGHQQSWTAARQGAASFLAQSGTLVGLTGLRRGLVLDVNPVVTSRTTGAPAPEGWSYDGGAPEFGANVRWGVTTNLTLNGTVNPDFSQVEADAGQLVFDPREALYFPEKRPFFLDGSEQFDTPSQLIYTRRIVAPVAATKLSGKISGTELGLLAAVDDRAYSLDGATPLYTLLRVRRDVGAGSTAGLVYTDRMDGADDNRVVGADARFVFGKLYALSVEAAESFDRTAGTSTAAPLWKLGFDRTGRAFGVGYRLEGIHQDFNAAAGYIPRAGIVHTLLSPHYTTYGAPGSAIETWGNSVSVDLTWDYAAFTAGRHAGDMKLHLNSNLQLRGGWRSGLAAFIESFAYPAALYSNYYIALPGPAGTDTVPFTGSPRIPNLDFMWTFGTPTWKTFDLSGFAILGRDENFFEWAPAYIAFLSASADWRPTDRIRVQTSYLHEQFVRASDRTTVGVTQIPRVKLEYQLSRPVFLRFVGQYVSDRSAALRDDSRTFAPILIRGPDGGFTPAAAAATNGFRADWLFSFQPTPGTVLFAGYGSSLADASAFGFRDLRRTADGFFVKLSYLFRM